MLAGDYNVVPTDFDIYDARHGTNDALLQPESRGRLSSGCSSRAGPTRSARCIPDEPIYTFWDYMRGRWGARRGAAHRPSAAQPGAAASASRTPASIEHVRGDEGASDHAPAWILLDG